MTSPSFEDRMKQERETYFANLPYNERIVRDVISALKDSGYFYNPHFDPETIALETILAPPTQSGCMRIMGLTEGPGKHQVKAIFGLINREYDVADNEVLVTIDDTASLAGRIATYRFKREGKGLKLTETDTHIMS